MARYDLVSIGEPLLRFSPPRHERIDHADAFDVCVIGSQLNIAADIVALGGNAAFLTQLPDNLLGELALNRFRQYRVDSTYVRREPNARIGATYVEFSVAPRSPRAVYDRRDSAASHINVDSFDWDGIAAQTDRLYTDGIFPALSRGCRDATLAFFQAGRRHHCTLCFDANFRSHLWTHREARDCWESFLPLIDCAVINRNVCEEIFQMRGDDSSLLEQFAARYGIGTVAFTARSGEGASRGAWHALLRMPDGSLHEGATEFEIIDRYGTGDAWFAGLIMGLKRHPDDPNRALAFANAVIALAHTTFSDIIQCTAEEAEALAAGEAARLRR